MTAWLTVLLLLAALMAVHARHLFRARRALLEQWNTLDNQLQQRWQLAGQLTVHDDDSAAVGATLRLLGQLAHAPMRRWQQRAAQESRLALQLQSLLQKSVGNPEIGEMLRTQERAVQTELDLYYINANRYNQRCEQFPGNIIALLCGLQSAPLIDIHPLEDDAGQAERAG